ncbi:MAG: MerR family transcriptional regulator [Sphingobacteriales bacterium]|nr:MAG: MerR family transcriptional regulator [Sphingobacteriales bacterium]TAF81257.1 MAG: MerR family transcriptional regulator [Sphingobacteriales bacterium]
MANPEKQLTKLYYPIGEVAQMFEVNTSMIRFYEKEFDILQPKLNAKGNRLFRPEDVENLKIIFNLIKNKGYTLQGAKEFLKNNSESAKENIRVIASLEKMKAFMLDLQAQM